MALYHKKRLLTKNFFCLLCVKSFVKFGFCILLDFDIDRKSANFHFENRQNISVDQIRFHFIVNLLWTFYGTQKILIPDMNFLKLALWNRTLGPEYVHKSLSRVSNGIAFYNVNTGKNLYKVIFFRNTSIPECISNGMPKNQDGYSFRCEHKIFFSKFEAGPKLSLSFKFLYFFYN